MCKRTEVASENFKFNETQHQQGLHKNKQSTGIECIQKLMHKNISQTYIRSSKRIVCLN
jgi:hypothetical protein